MAVTNASPSTVSAANPTSTNQIGSGSGNAYKLNMFSYSSRAWSPRVEVTGDGDSSPVFKNNGFLYFRVQISGAMIAAQAIGLSNLVTANPTSAVDLLLTNNRKIALAKILIEDISFTWQKPRGNGAGGIIPVSFTGWASETTAASIEAAIT